MKRTPLYRHSKLRPVSAKRIKLNRIYSALRKKFLEEHPWCEFRMAELGLSLDDVQPDGIAEWNWGFKFGFVQLPRSEDIHHKKGRGKYLLDTSTWMAVSREGHLWIHQNPKEAYEKGYMLQR